jgi:hypothetical protein
LDVHVVTQPVAAQLKPVHAFGTSLQPPAELQVLTWCSVPPTHDAAPHETDASG